MDKILLSGRPRSGKSAFIQACLRETPLPLGGFAVQRLTRNGETWAFRLLDLHEEPYITHLETSRHFPDIAIFMASPGKWQGIPAVFDDKGSRALARCLEGNSLVIMDELGIYERDALEFQAHVFRVLDSPLPVLGVLKDKSSPFLDKVRRHPAVSVLPFPAAASQAAVRAFLDQVRSR
ncbi:MAG TPA: nucleoside-triphosphatase [Bacillota bacterium]|nr:nucleoside-triphosphatase [Bacillota bacterium]